MDISFFVRQSDAALARFSDSSAAVRFETGPAMTFGELRADAWRYANGLMELGVRPGDRVAVALYNSVDYWALYFAITRIGAIIVRVNFRLRGSELEFVLRDSGSSVVVAEPEILAEIEPYRETLGLTRAFANEEASDSRSWWRSLPSLRADSAAEPAIERSAPDAPAMIMYTSGTTGLPKGVTWTHSSTTQWAGMQQIEWKFSEDSVTMATGPMYHIGALENYAMGTLASGGQVVVFGSRGFTIDRAVDVATRTGVTDMLMFPAMLQDLARLDEPTLAGLHRLRRIFTGGDAVAPSLVEKLGRVLPHVELTQVYGLTEGTPMAVSSPAGLTRQRPDLVGRPFPFTEVSIRDDAGTELPPGESGEIWTRSPANSIGYWNRPDENARTFNDGWCRTGDSGVIDDGYLRFVGRKKDIVRSGGENISPAEVEDILKQHPGVMDAAVVGVPHPRLVEAVAAVIVARADAAPTEDELIDYCGSRLAGYKKPRAVMFVDELPRTPSQKVQKFLLRERFASSGIRAR